MILINLFFTLLTVILVLIIGIMLIPATIIRTILKKKNSPKLDMFCQRFVQFFVFKPLLFVMGGRLKVYGLENIPKDTPCVYMGNHRSLLDCVIIYPYVHGLCGIIAKKEIEKAPIIPSWMNHLHCLFLDRDNVREGLKVILTSIDYLKNGCSMLIMPEGTRSYEPNNGLLPFKDGSMKMATKSGCPIVPIAITGSEHLFEAHRPLLGPAKLTMTIGKPIDVKSLSRDEQKVLAPVLQDVIAKMLAAGPGTMVDADFSQAAQQ